MIQNIFQNEQIIIAKSATEIVCPNPYFFCVLNCYLQSPHRLHYFSPPPPPISLSRSRFNGVFFTTEMCLLDKYVFLEFCWIMFVVVVVVAKIWISFFRFHKTIAISLVFSEITIVRIF